MPSLICPDCAHAADVPDGPGPLKAWCPRCRRLFEAPPPPAPAAGASLPDSIPVATPLADEPARSPFDFGPPRPAARKDRHSPSRLTPAEARLAREQAIRLAVL